MHASPIDERCLCRCNHLKAPFAGTYFSIMPLYALASPVPCTPSTPSPCRALGQVNGLHPISVVCVCLPSQVPSSLRLARRHAFSGAARVIYPTFEARETGIRSCSFPPPSASPMILLSAARLPRAPAFRACVAGARRHSGRRFIQTAPGAAAEAYLEPVPDRPGVVSLLLNRPKARNAISLRLLKVPLLAYLWRRRAGC